MVCVTVCQTVMPSFSGITDVSTIDCNLKTDRSRTSLFHVAQYWDDIIGRVHIPRRYSATNILSYLLAARLFFSSDWSHTVYCVSSSCRKHACNGSIRLVHIQRCYSVTKVLTYLMTAILDLVRFVSCCNSGQVFDIHNTHAMLEWDWVISQDAIVSQTF